MCVNYPVLTCTTEIETSPILTLFMQITSDDLNATKHPLSFFTRATSKHTKFASLFCASPNYSFICRVFAVKLFSTVFFSSTNDCYNNQAGRPDSSKNTRKYTQSYLIKPPTDRFPVTPHCSRFSRRHSHGERSVGRWGTPNYARGY